MKAGVKNVFFLEGSGGLRLSCVRWTPDRTSTAAVVFAHGYSGYAEGYERAISMLVEAGCAGYALDHMGHGSSEGKRASLDRFDDLTDDFELLVGKARQDMPGTSVFTFGHSMGGLIVTRHAMLYPESISGTVATSSAFIAGQEPNEAKVALLTRLSKILPDLPAIGSGSDRSMRNTLAGRPQPGSIYSYHGRIRLNLAREIWQAGQETLLLADRLGRPILFQHGGADEVTLPEGSHICYQRAASSDKSLAIWRDREHNLLTGSGWQDVVSQAADWILSRSD